MKFALLTVSYGGLFYRGEALSLDNRYTKQKNLDLMRWPLKRNDLLLPRLILQKQIVTASGKSLQMKAFHYALLKAYRIFAGRYMEERVNNLAMMRLVLELAKDLGVKLVKIFAAWPGIINDEDAVAMYGQFERGNYYKRLFPAELRRWNHCVEGIREVAGMAADMGLTLALQNHAPVLSKGYEDTLIMMQEIDRRNIKLCIDVPLFYERQSDEYVREAVQKCGKHLVHTHYGAWNFSQANDGEIVPDPSPSSGDLINYPAFIEELHNIGYSGFLTSEYCLPVYKKHQLAGIEEVDHATRITLQYMKRLVQNTILA